MPEIKQKQAELSGSEQMHEQVAATNAVSGILASVLAQTVALTDGVEVDPRLTKFAEMYNKWSAVSKSRLDWKKVQAALLVDNGALLAKVEAIPNGPSMFGADKDGNMLFANYGCFPILEDKPKYVEARIALHNIGLELFPYIESNEKSEEMIMFEKFTGGSLVSDNGLSQKRDAMSWLESGDIDEKTEKPNFAYCSGGRSTVTNYMPLLKQCSLFGVRGLLRAKA